MSGFHSDGLDPKPRQASLVVQSAPIVTQPMTVRVPVPPGASHGAPPLLCMHPWEARACPERIENTLVQRGRQEEGALFSRLEHRQLHSAPFVPSQRQRHPIPLPFYIRPRLLPPNLLLLFLVDLFFIPVPPWRPPRRLLQETSTRSSCRPSTSARTCPLSPGC